jgi:predicted enzyme related to lactoylglutathione lyase
MKLTYVMKFVSNMDDAVHFYRDALGLPLKSQSPVGASSLRAVPSLLYIPHRSEILRGTVELGFSVDDLQAFHAAMTAKGVTFPMPPKEQEFGSLAQFLDSEGSACSVWQERNQLYTPMAKKRTVSDAFGHAAREVEDEVKRAIDYIESNIVPRARRDGPEHWRDGEHALGGADLNTVTCASKKRKSRPSHPQTRNERAKPRIASHRIKFRIELEKKCPRGPFV